MDAIKPKQQKKEEEHFIDLKTLLSEKQIHPVLSSQPVTDSGANNGGKQSHRERNKCRFVLDSGASTNVFYNGNLIENIQFLDDPTIVTTGGCIPLKYSKVRKLNSKTASSVS